MTPNDVLSWTLVGVLAAGIIVAGVYAYMGVGAWLQPRFKKLQRGESRAPNRARKYCCPAGLGCNDPDSTYQRCRRQRAREVATHEEFNRLEETWSAFSAAKAPRAKGKALKAYEAQRNAIITRAVNESITAANNGAGERKELLGGLDEEVDGEYVGKGKRGH